MIEINPYVWFGARQLDIVPPHFFKSMTPVHSDSYFWVRSKLTGRFAVHTSDITTLEVLFDLRPYIFFEDPKEMMLYELRWAGSK